MELQASIDRFASPLTGLFVSWGVPIGEATELAQDSLADAHLSLASCRGDSDDVLVFGRWLRGVARNHFRQWSRGRARRGSLAIVIPSQALEELASRVPEIDQRITQLRVEIQRLSAKHREVVIMHYLDETPVADGRSRDSRRLVRRRFRLARTIIEFQKQSREKK